MGGFVASQCHGRLAQRVREVLGPVTGLLGREVADLLAAGDAGDGDRPAALLLSLDRREELERAHRFRRLVVLLLEAERPCHAAARGVDELRLVARDAERLQRRGRAHERLLVAVAVHLHLRLAALRECGAHGVRFLGSELHEQFVQHERLACHGLRRAVAQQFGVLVAEREQA